MYNNNTNLLFQPELPDSQHTDSMTALHSLFYCVNILEIKCCMKNIKLYIDSNRHKH